MTGKRVAPASWRPAYAEGGEDNTCILVPTLTDPSGKE
jgi:hypothetical protein